MRRIQRKIAVAVAGAAVALLTVAAAAAGEDPGSPAQESKSHAVTASRATPSTPVILDQVVAAVNGSVILSSDVQEEMRFTRLQPGRDPRRNTPERALRRLIDRDLIREQMKAYQIQIKPPTEEKVKQQLAELRKQLPQCAQYHCETDAGWNALLASDGLTEAELEKRWRERMIILSFIQSRFGAGVRISPEQIEDYYQKSFLPEFQKRDLSPPPLASVSKRIQEILLQERVNELLRDWLTSLKQEGSVKILNGSSQAVTGTESASESRP